MTEGRGERWKLRLVPQLVLLVPRMEEEGHFPASFTFLMCYIAPLGFLIANRERYDKLATNYFILYL